MTLTVETPDPEVLVAALDMSGLPFAVVCGVVDGDVLFRCGGVEVNGTMGPLEAMRKVQTSLSPLFRAATDHHRDRGGLLWQDVAAADVRTAAV